MHGLGGRDDFPSPIDINNSNPPIKGHFKKDPSAKTISNNGSYQIFILQINPPSEQLVHSSYFPWAERRLTMDENSITIRQAAARDEAWARSIPLNSSATELVYNREKVRSCCGWLCWASAFVGVWRVAKMKRH